MKADEKQLGLTFDGTLLQMARDALDAARRVEKPENARQAIVTILFSAVAIEAFVNEFSEIMEANERIAAEWEQHLAGELSHAEANRCSAFDKLVLLATHLAGRNIDIGRNPWQDASILYDLRSYLAHRKPGRFAGVKDENGVLQFSMLAHRLQRDLEARRLLTDAEPNLLAGLTLRLQTLDAAVWAIRTVEKVICSMYQSIHAPTDRYCAARSHMWILGKAYGIDLPQPSV